MSDGLQTDFAHADQSPGLLLWQVTNRWQAAIRAALAPLDLTHVQFVLLASLTYLSGNGRPITQRTLADHAATDPMMTSQVLRALESKGLVQRRDHPDDRRAKAVAPTKTGVALANRAVGVVERRDAEFFTPLGDQGKAFARSLLRLRERSTGSVSTPSSI